MAILFLCTANSCRSQMAEGLCRRLSGGKGVYSAGTEPGSVHPRAVEALREVGIDISSHRSKGIDEIPRDAIETVITLCDDAARCPLPLPGVSRVHWPIPDPGRVMGTEDEIRQAFREVRDDLRWRIEDLLHTG